MVAPGTLSDLSSAIRIARKKKDEEDARIANARMERYRLRDLRYALQELTQYWNDQCLLRRSGKPVSKMELTSTLEEYSERLSGFAARARVNGGMSIWTYTDHEANFQSVYQSISRKTYDPLFISEEGARVFWESARRIVDAAMREEPVSGLLRQAMSNPDFDGLFDYVMQMIEAIEGTRRWIVRTESGASAWVDELPIEPTLAEGTEPLDDPVSTNSPSVEGNPVLDKETLAVLKFLDENQGVCKHNVDIEAGTELCKATVRRAVTWLIKKSLASRPNGERKGTTISDQGIALMERILNHT